jgi:quercetin dioxygenase-like cupin family protein
MRHHCIAISEESMSGIGAPALTLVKLGEGRAGDLGSIGVAFKLWGEHTGGAISIVEHPFPVGALVPPHLDTREEYSIVTEGEIGFRSGDREAVLGPGGTARPSSGRAGISPNRAASCT